MSLTPHLALPLIAAGQAQKHVTHNEALAALDALLHLSAASRASAPPPDPAGGERLLVADAPAGAFAGRAGQVAWFDAGAWRFLEPRAGWRLHLADEGRLLVYDGAAWGDVGALIGRLDRVEAIGLGAAADLANPFSARLGAALFTADDGGSVRVSLNRTAAGGTASHLYQTAFSGRAETGLSGDDDWRLKVSPDGVAWTTVLRAPASGGALLPGGDGAQALGSAALRWANLYATTGAIQTSDAREKTEVAPLSGAEIAAGAALAGEIGAFRFLDAVAAKGGAARLHVGLTVQRAIAAFEAHGLDPFAYGLVCRDAFESGERLAFRPDELLLLIARALAARADALEARLAALEARLA